MTVVVTALVLAACGGAPSSPRAGSSTTPTGAPSTRVAVPLPNAAVRTVAVGSKPCAATYDGVDVWVSLYGDNRVAALDPRTGRVRRTLPTGVTPCGLQVAAGLLWVGDVSAGTVEALDRRTGRRRHLVSVGGQIWDVRASGDVVWTDDHEGVLVRIDARTGQSRRIAVGAIPSGLAADPGGVWVADNGDGHILRVSAAGAIVRRVAVGDSPTWFADDKGTLAVSDPGTPGEWILDPTTGAPRHDAQIQGMPNDGDAIAGVVFEPESSSGDLWRIDVATGATTVFHPPAPLTVVESLAGALWGLEFSGDRVVRINASALP